MRSRLARAGVLAAVLLLCAAAVVAGHLHRVVESPLALTQPLEISVGRGTSLVALLDELQSRALVAEPLVWRLYARLYGLESVKAGDYRLAVGSSGRQLLEAVTRGDVVVEKVTFPEGWTVSQWQAVLRERGLLAAGQSVQGSELAAFAAAQAASGATSDSVEGWLFPDTYHYSGADWTGIGNLAVQRMAAELAEVWRTRADDLPYQTPYELLIMASIIERETGQPSERSQIAGVFVRRLQRGMRLQTDPTVIYGIGEAFDGDLRRADLKRPTPYNTYVIAGLPPTPIANPGLAALQAAAHPLAGEWLYFVGKGDGSHQFSVTLAQHQAAVRRYQRFRRAEQYRSAPR